MIHQVDRRRIDLDQRHAAIQPAMDEEIAPQRDDMLGAAARLGLAVVRAHDDDIRLPRLQLVGYIEAKAREGALVLPDMLAVDPKVGDRTDAIELQDRPFPFGQGRLFEPQPVPARSLAHIGFPGALGRIIAHAVPAVRQADLLPLAVVESGTGNGLGRIAELETPALVERANPASIARSGLGMAGRRRTLWQCLGQARHGHHHRRQPQASPSCALQRARRPAALSSHSTTPCILVRPNTIGAGVSTRNAEPRRAPPSHAPPQALRARKRDSCGDQTAEGDARAAFVWKMQCREKEPLRGQPKAAECDQDAKLVRSNLARARIPSPPPTAPAENDERMQPGAPQPAVVCGTGLATPLFWPGCETRPTAALCALQASPASS